MIKMLDSGEEQTIIVNKGATGSLMFMQKLENRIFFSTFLFIYGALILQNLVTITFTTFNLFPLTDEYLEWLNQ